jgi:hypothetical protein
LERIANQGRIGRLRRPRRAAQCTKSSLWPVVVQLYELNAVVVVVSGDAAS